MEGLRPADDLTCVAGVRAVGLRAGEGVRLAEKGSGD